MNLVYLGSGEFGIASLNELLKSEHKVKLIVTSPPRPAGRGRKQVPTAVGEWGVENGIDVMETDDVNTGEAMATIAAHRPDLLVVIAFGQKISNELIDVPKYHAINVHSSLLPKYRGAAPINWAVIEGEKETGVSIITLAEKMDAGQIVATAKTEIGEKETAGELHDRLAEIAGPLLVKTINEIEEGQAEFVEQDHSKATLAKKLKKSDGYIDFDEPAEVVKNKIHGFYPWPEATAVYYSNETGKKTRVILARVRAVETDNRDGLEPGSFDEYLNVICGTGAIAIEKIKPAGKNLIDFGSFVNGRRTKPGDKLLKIEK